MPFFNIPETFLSAVKNFSVFLNIFGQPLNKTKAEIMFQTLYFPVRYVKSKRRLPIKSFLEIAKFNFDFDRPKCSIPFRRSSRFYMLKIGNVIEKMKLVKKNKMVPVSVTH